MNRRNSKTEMRDSPRFEADFIVCLEGQRLGFKSRGNVGIGGFCFESKAAIRPGTKLELCFELSGADRFIVVKGEVLGLSAHKGWVGVRGRFTEIEFEDERSLARWLDHQAAYEQSRLVA